MPAPTHQLDDDDNLEMPPTKSAKATDESEVSLKDLFKVQIILHPVAPLEGLWQGEWGHENQ